MVIQEKFDVNGENRAILFLSSLQLYITSINTGLMGEVKAIMFVIQLG